MMFYSAHLLVILMAFSCNKNYIALNSQHTSCLDCLMSVYYCNDLFHVLSCQPRQHIIDYILRLLETRIIGCDDNLITVLNALLCHQRTFSLISVSSCTDDCNNSAIS